MIRMRPRIRGTTLRRGSPAVEETGTATSKKDSGVTHRNGNFAARGGPPRGGAGGTRSRSGGRTKPGSQKKGNIRGEKTVETKRH